MENKILLKKELYIQCKNYVKQKVNLAKQGMNEAQRAANEETKSSAGDKYETGRAMMHLEKEKYARQLADAIKIEQSLGQVLYNKKYEQIQQGALVKTNRGNYFMSISAGKIKIDEITYYAISLASPLGKVFFNAKAGDVITFRQKTYQILSVC